jgi:hypothetical protein
MIVEISKKAVTELNATKQWYDEQEPRLGDLFLDEVEFAVARILQFSTAFPEIRPRIRRCLLRKFPYAVLYDAESVSNTVLILTVYHQFRNPKTILKF